MTVSKRNSVNRKNGEDFERKIVNKFKIRSDVLYVQRGSGSFGTWDVMVHFKNGIVLYITAKLNGYHDRGERQKIKKFVEQAKNVKNVRMEMWYYKTARKVCKMKIKTSEHVNSLNEMRRVTA